MAMNAAITVTGRQRNVMGYPQHHRPIGAHVVIVYIIIFLAVVTCIGKIVNSRQSGEPGYRAKFFGLQSTKSAFDREENPRSDDDGTSFGYRPGD